MIVGFGVFLLALSKKSEELKRAGLAVLFAIALISLPTYMTGYSAQKAVRAMPGVSRGVIDLHQRSALLALMFMEATGVVAWYGLWSSRRGSSSGAGNTATVLLLGALTMGLLSSAENIGGEIGHPALLRNPAPIP